MATNETNPSSESAANEHAVQAIESAIHRHLKALNDVQTSLLAALRCKRKALETSDFSGVRRFAAEEERLMSECSRLERERQAILRATEKAGVRAASLTDLASKLSLSAELRTSLASMRSDAESIQRESWTQLIVASRASQHYEELIGIIVSGSDSNQSFGVSEGYDSGGGTIIDAAA